MKREDILKEPDGTREQRHADSLFPEQRTAEQRQDHRGNAAGNQDHQARSGQNIGILNL